MARDAVNAEVRKRRVRARFKELNSAGLKMDDCLEQVAYEFTFTTGTVQGYLSMNDDKSLDVEIAEYEAANLARMRRLQGIPKVVNDKRQVYGVKFKQGELPLE